MPRSLPLERPLVIGFGLAGRAVVRALIARGGVDPASLTVIDDKGGDAMASAVRDLGARFLGPADAHGIDAVVAAASAVFPSPGIPDDHPVMVAAERTGVPVFGEFDLVDAWDDRPLVVITGTDGKTTVTTMVTEMLRASGRAVVAAGNNELPLVDAIADPTVEVFVVEASSFRLGHTATFRPTVGTWLNFAPDHIDNHLTLDRYEAAKAKLFGFVPPEGTAVVNADDPVVARHTPAHCRVLRFSTAPGTDAAYRVEDGTLVGGADVLVGVDELARSLPHDIANALAAAATARAGGAGLDAVRAVLASFRGLPHRVQQVAAAGGVTWFDDSKATTPHAALTAIRGFDSVVLIAGGSDKGADLSVLTEAADHLRAVITIGVTGPAIAAAFDGVRPTHPATDMVHAVRIARTIAGPGDTVLLSPACASFDMFDNYAHRGDTFAAAVREALAEEGPR